MPAPQIWTPQYFPTYYSGNAQFLDSKGVPTGEAGAKATVPITINNNPQLWTGFRVTNVYEIPDGYQTSAFLTLLARLDEEQIVTTELTQNNVVVRSAVQRNVIGGAPSGSGGINWSPFPVPFPWKGGDNVTFTFERLTAYPTSQGEIVPTVYVTIEGATGVSDAHPPAAPGTTGYPS